MDRVYAPILISHITNDTQMIFLAGPRQIGKTTISKNLGLKEYDTTYLNWDDKNDKDLILRGSEAILKKIYLAKARKHKPIVVFDELHKLAKWKNFLKGFYDKNKDTLHIIITGSAKLYIYQKVSDSLMGRYFLYSIHPVSSAEIATPINNRLKEIQVQSKHN